MSESKRRWSGVILTAREAQQVAHFVDEHQNSIGEGVIVERFSNGRLRLRLRSQLDEQESARGLS